MHTYTQSQSRLKPLCCFNMSRGCLFHRNPINTCLRFIEPWQM
ncbi:hypothetical protein MMALV_00160 [Candidatus Methanomethylophilus alvi Mx1201]|uniref:Uncharacterized protein n=1 Tax=Methanomethylophilus alvi (strain Mx1201) TaxID=1236689 RepID=M9SEU0_METAX|nr:hypothetical protein MMALV_00160 [Candidatus Methanomethylophilus alvi Mx1201]